MDLDLGEHRLARDVEGRRDGCEPRAERLVDEPSDGPAAQRGSCLELPIDVLVEIPHGAIDVLVVTPR